MRILGRATYEGPNPFGPNPLVRATVDFRTLAERPTASMPGAFLDRLAAAAPDVLAQPWGMTAVPIAVAAREGTRIVPDLVVELARALQRSTAARIDRAEARTTGRRTVRHLLVGYEDPEIGRHALTLAIALARHALPPDDPALGAMHAPLGLPAAVEGFSRIVSIHQLDLLTRAIVRLARARGIPVLRLGSRHIVQLGLGRRQQRISSTMSGRTTAVARAIAGDKSLASDLMRQAGLPVPAHFRVTSAETAAVAAERLGVPVVVKANDQDMGRGVFPGLKDPAAIRRAYAAAARFGRVIVEKHVEGDDHRILVVRGRAVAVARRRSARVVGDGVRSVRALVDDLNRDPRRGTGYANLLVTVELDREAARVLQEQGLDVDSVPAPGQVAILRRAGNISVGGTSVDVTGEAHPDYLRAAEIAARTVGLDIAGVDFLTTDIRRPPSLTGAAICEINPVPGLRPHLLDPRSPDTVAAILQGMLEDGTTGAIPIAAITGSNGKTTTARMVARIMRRTGAVTGLATTTGVSIDDRVIEDGDLAGPSGARMIFLDPTADVAVAEVARGGIVRYGLGFNRCTVGAVLNVQDDHVGTIGIASRTELAAVKGLVVEAAVEMAVLNASDPLCVAMRRRTPARTVCWVAADPEHPLVGDCRLPDDIAVTMVGEGSEATIVLRARSAETRIIAVDDIPATDGGRALHNVENAMFAAAIAWGLGAPASAIADGLAAYDLSYETTRGRLAIHDGLPFRVIVDYGHNAVAVAAIGRYASKLPIAGRRLCMLNSPANRIAAHYTQAAAAAAASFDRFWCTGPDALRGRTQGEVPRLLAEGLMAAGVPAERVVVVDREEDAVPAVLRAASPGDLVTLFCHDPDRCWNQVRAHLA